MNDHGGLTAISPYEIGRHWWLQQLRVIRAIRRVHNVTVYKKASQCELLKLRRDHYGEKRTAKPVAEKAKG